MNEPRSPWENLILAIASISWGWMIFEAAGSRRLSCCAPDPSILAEAGSWTLMVAAMMLPTTTFAVRDVAERSFRRRRLRAVLGYLSGYMSCWLLAGIVFLSIRSQSLAHDLRTASALCLLAAFWAALPARALWLARCHRQLPLCPYGFRADLDTFRQGAFHSTACVRTCWPLMFACAITGHDLVVMIGGAVMAISEKRMFRLNRKPLILGALALGIWVLARWGLG